MKKNIIFLLFIIGMIITTSIQAQFVKVRNPLTAGITTGGISPSCNSVAAGTLTSTPATGGDSTGYAYQWQSSSNNVVFSNIPLATTLSYAIPPLSNTMYFRLMVTDLCGIVYSNTITITVYNVFAYTGGTTISGGTAIPICYNTSGGTMTAPTVTGGAPGTVTQWQLATTVDSTNFTNISGANASTYATGLLTGTTWYRVLETNTCGVLTSTVKKIVVYNNFAYTGGTTISGGTAIPICYNTSGGTMTAPTVTGGAPGTVTQWQIATTVDSTNFTNISGANASTYNTGLLTGTSWYRVLETNTCGVLTSTVKKIVVYNNFAYTGGTTISGGITPTCYNTTGGTMTAPTVTGGAPGTVTQWQIATTVDSTNFTNISGANASTYNTGLLTGTSWYRVLETNTCGVLTSTVKKIKVWGIFNPGIVTTDTITICHGTTPPPFVNLVSPSGGDGVYTYLWLESATNAAPWVPATGVNNLPNYQPPVLYNQMGYRRQVTNATCGNTANSIAQ